MSTTPHSSNRDEAAYLIHKIAVEYGGELLGGHQWAWEFTRWYELVFALLTQIATVDQKALRHLTNEMAALGLLNIESLSKLAKSADIAHLPHGRRIIELCRENEFTNEQALCALTTISEVALTLHTQYDGHLQKYLRSYGELMLKDLERSFTFSTLGKIEVANAFTYWLQNVLSMPLSLIDDNVQRLCRDHNLQPQDLIAAADDVNLNVAFMDDLACLYNARRPRM